MARSPAYLATPQPKSPLCTQDTLGSGSRGTPQMLKTLSLGLLSLPGSRKLKSLGRHLPPLSGPAAWPSPKALCPSPGACRTCTSPQTPHLCGSLPQMPPTLTDSLRRLSGSHPHQILRLAAKSRQLAHPTRLSCCSSPSSHPPSGKSRSGGRRAQGLLGKRAQARQRHLLRFWRQACRGGSLPDLKAWLRFWPGRGEAPTRRMPLPLAPSNIRNPDLGGWTGLSLVQ